MASPSRLSTPSSSSKQSFQRYSPDIFTFDCPQAQPLHNSFDAFKLAAAQQISQILSIDIKTAFAGLETGRKGADISVPIPKYRLGKAVDPKQAAKKVVDAFKPNDYLSHADCQGGLILAFNVQHKTLANLVLNQINELEHVHKPTKAQCIGFGSNVIGLGKKAIVEFSSPNIAKPFHAGHLRSTIIGAFLAQLYEANGWSVTRMIYLGDWGKQFGLLSVGYKKYGSDPELEKDAIKHLYEVYVKINADANKESADHVAQTRADKRAQGLENVPADDAKPTIEEEQAANAASPTHTAARLVFQKLEAGDEAELARWQQFRDLSIVKYKETFERLNVWFDVYSGESQVSKESIDEAMDHLVREQIASEDKGALVADLEKYKLGRNIVRKRDGTTTYISRDIAEAKRRWDLYHFDKSVYVVAVQQEFHLAQLFKICKLMKYDWADRLEHVKFGMIEGMSTRKGTAVFLEQILDEAQTIMHDQAKKTEEKYAQIDDPERMSDVLGMSAVKIQDMCAKRINNYVFDWSRMTSYLGDTGPYLQYAHVRLSSIVRKAAPEVVMPPPEQVQDTIKTELLVEPKARDIIMLLASWPDIVIKSLEGSEPSAIVSFCWRLTHAISSAYEALNVKGEEQQLALARLFLYVSAKDVLASAMKLLTLTPLERM